MNVSHKVNLIFVDNSTEAIGIKIEKEVVNFFLPECFCVGERCCSDKVHAKIIENIALDELNQNLKRDLLRFISSLSLVDTHVSNNVKQDKQNEQKAIPYESFLWLINDYLENGVFYNREKIFCKDLSGKIDWKRTLKGIPFISSGNIIYNKFVVSRMVSTEDSLSQIYKICVKASVSVIGWAFNYNFFVDAVRTKTVSEMVYIVKKELSVTFDDIKRLRLKHMLKVLESINDSELNSSHYTYTVNNYYTVFEKMVDKFFLGLKEDEKKKFYPESTWTFPNTNDQLCADNVDDEFAGIGSLRPDTVCKKDGKIYILDSKMYRYGITGDIKHLPSMSSIQKQISYGEWAYYLDRNESDEPNIVRNAFILPFDKQTHQDLAKNKLKVGKGEISDNLFYVGYATSKLSHYSSVNPMKDYEYVFTYLLDFNYLLNNYDKTDIRKLEQLIKDIEQRLSAKKR